MADDIGVKSAFGRLWYVIIQSTVKDVTIGLYKRDNLGFFSCAISLHLLRYDDRSFAQLKKNTLLSNMCGNSQFYFFHMILLFNLHFCSIWNFEYFVAILLRKNTLYLPYPKRISDTLPAPQTPRSGWTRTGRTSPFRCGSKLTARATSSTTACPCPRSTTATRSPTSWSPTFTNTTKLTSR